MPRAPALDTRVLRQGRGLAGAGGLRGVVVGRGQDVRDGQTSSLCVPCRGPERVGRLVPRVVAGLDAPPGELDQTSNDQISILGVHQRREPPRSASTSTLRQGRVLAAAVVSP